MEISYNPNWTPEKLASLGIVKQIANLPFEVGLWLNISDDTCIVERYDFGGLESVIATVLPAELPVNSQLVHVHNHPLSGQYLNFSDSDYECMKINKEQVKQVGCELLDTMIVSEGFYCSMLENDTF